jgi:hypothetical protein
MGGCGHARTQRGSRKQPRGSRADRTYDEQIVMACGEKLAYGYRRVAWYTCIARAAAFESHHIKALAERLRGL